MMDSYVTPGEEKEPRSIEEECHLARANEKSTRGYLRREQYDLVSKTKVEACVQSRIIIRDRIQQKSRTLGLYGSVWPLISYK